MLLLDRNKSVDLMGKSKDWFLHTVDIRPSWVSINNFLLHNHKILENVNVIKHELI